MTWHPDIPLKYRNRIVTGDARILSESIPDESIDLIFTDPVYQNIDDYRWLAETAARVLKPNGMLLTFFGIGFLPETLAALSEHLVYRWELGAFQPNGPSRRGAYRGFSKWLACLWFDKDGQSKTPNHWPDMVYSIGFRTRFGTHKWRKNPSVFLSWLKGFSGPGSIILDPFTGGGTVPSCCVMLDRQYVAFEIEPETAALARDRIVNTQPPLFVPEPEQAVMEFAL